MGTSLPYSYDELPVVGAPSLTWRVKPAIITKEDSHVLTYGKENHLDFSN